MSEPGTEWERLFEAAAVARATGDYAAAVRHLRAALVLQPRAAIGHLMLSLSLTEAGLLDEAIATAGEACSLAPDSAAAHYALGRARRLAGMPEAAVESFDAALSLKPIQAETHYERALALAALRRREEAVEALKAGLVCAPRHKGLKALARRLSLVGKSA